MAKYKIANFITEFTPKYNTLKQLAKPFEYNGNDNPKIILELSDEELDSIYKKMENDVTLEQAEEFAYASKFNRTIIQYNAMLVHSSAIVINNQAYLFSAKSGVGKSTHTKLWQKAFGSDKVKIINDDKPVVRITDGNCIAYGTPFDGGSGIATNLSAPLKAIIFLERGEENSIRKATTSEIIQNLYLSTIHFVSKDIADSMLVNFDNLIKCADFYILTCNTDVSAAYVAYDTLIK